MQFQGIAQRWRDLLRKSRTGRKEVTGIYGQPRGGTNFIAAALHYHPRLFAVNEHVFDYRVPLRSIWWKASVFAATAGRTNRSNNSPRSFTTRCRRSFRNCGILAAVFRRGAASFSTCGTQSACTFHARLTASGTNRDGSSGPTLITTSSPSWPRTREIIEAYEELKHRHPCFVLSHEYFCCGHKVVLPRLHQFLGVEPLAPCNPRDFLRRCGSCRREFTVTSHEGQEWLACPSHRQPVSGQGRFNPLRPIDRKGILADSWKTTPGVGHMLSDLRKRLGSTIADYFWNSNYSENLVLERAAVSRAA